MVRYVARHGPPDDGAEVEVDDEGVGLFGREAVGGGVRGDVGDWDEEGEFEEEDGGRGEEVQGLTEGEEVDGRAGAGVGGEAGGDEGAGEEAEEEAD